LDVEFSIRGAPSPWLRRLNSAPCRIAHNAKQDEIAAVQCSDSCWQRGQYLEKSSHVSFALSGFVNTLEKIGIPHQKQGEEW